MRLTKKLLNKMIVEELARLNEASPEETKALIRETVKKWNDFRLAGLELREQIKKLPNIEIKEEGRQDDPSLIAMYVWAQTQETLQNSGPRLNRIFDEMNKAQTNPAGTPNP